MRRAGELGLVERSQLTVEAVRYFLFQGSSTDPYARNNFTTDRVAQFYRYLSDLWPHRLSAIESLRDLRDDDALTGYYVGDPRPETIIHNVARLALYADRIFVPQPFYKPWAMVDEYDPVQHPGPVLLNTRAWAVATLLLQPWINSGLVVFVPDPADFDSNLRQAFREAGLRREAEGKIRVLPEDLARAEKFFKADFIRQLYSLPDDAIIRELRKSSTIADADVPKTLAEIHRDRDADPLYVPGAAEHNPLMLTQLPTIDETILTCGLTNAFPFTDSRGRWNELREELAALPPDAELWSPLTQAFAQCKLQFLNMEDTRLAYRIREDGYLTSFRSYLRGLWKSIDGSADDGKFASSVRDLADRLRDEHRLAETEWKTIHAKYDNTVRRSGITAAVSGVAGALTGLGYISVALSFITHLLVSRTRENQLGDDLRSARARIPMSIFLDLE